MRLILVVLASVSLSAQAPRPFPQPNQPLPSPTPTSQARSNEVTPTEATLGTPIFPNAQFIASYEAGRGQRFYLFGSTAGYLDVVNYYKTVLKQRGTELFESPPTHQFDTTRFREETMAYPPGVTVKDYTWGGSPGYPSVKQGQPARFPTVIQIVPVPPGTSPGD